jgi:hypothetical protein
VAEYSDDPAAMLASLRAMMQQRGVPMTTENLNRASLAFSQRNDNPDFDKAIERSMGDAEGEVPQSQTRIGMQPPANAHVPKGVPPVDSSNNPTPTASAIPTAEPLGPPADAAMQMPPTEELTAADPTSLRDLMYAGAQTYGREYAEGPLSPVNFATGPSGMVRGVPQAATIPAAAAPVELGVTLAPRSMELLEAAPQMLPSAAPRAAARGSRAEGSMRDRAARRNDSTKSKD